MVHTFNVTKNGFFFLRKRFFQCLNQLKQKKAHFNSEI